ncbi:MAG: hypothetical protein ACREMS_06440 [Gemmatimonadaceae bacterium]
MNFIRKSALLFVAASIWLTADACEKPAPPSVPAVAGAGGGPTNTIAQTTNRLVELATSGIDTTATLADWLEQNPHDSLSGRLGRTLAGNPDCQVSISKSNFTSRQVTRFARFSIYPPPDEKLPEDTTDLVRHFCRLRGVFFESEETDSATLATMYDSLEFGIAARLGDWKHNVLVDDALRDGWVQAKIWQTPGNTVTLAIAPSDSALIDAIRRNRMPAKPSFARGKIVLSAVTPGKVVGSFDYWTTKYFEGIVPWHAGAEQDLEDADSAIAWARLPGVAADLDVMLAEIRLRNDQHGVTRKPETDSALLRAIRAIRDTGPKLEPSRRAAALVAGDLVRYATVPYPPMESYKPDRKFFDAAQAIVLGPDVDQTQSGYWFNRVWLWDAYDLDSLGRAGHLALVRLLRRGFRNDAECADGVDFYQTVIDRGEADIRRGDADPLVHYYVGVAYESLFDYSNFVPEDTSIHNPSKAEGETARLKAIDHLRASLAGLRDKQMRRDAWVMSAELMLRQPGNPPYNCASEDD